MEFVALGCWSQSAQQRSQLFTDSCQSLRGQIVCPHAGLSGSSPSPHTRGTSLSKPPQGEIPSGLQCRQIITDQDLRALELYTAIAASNSARLAASNTRGSPNCAPMIPPPSGPRNAPMKVALPLRPKARP